MAKRANKQLSEPFEYLDESLRKEKDWKVFYPQMINFQQKYGHFNIPYHLSKYRPLYKWICKQRKLNETKNLSPLRKRTLSQIGITWKLHDSWENMLVELIAYKKKRGTVSITSSDPVHRKLKVWLIKIKKQGTRLSASRRKILQKIGINIPGRNSISKSDIWEKTYRKLCKFHAIHGHIKIQESNKSNYELRAWIKKQRRNKEKLSKLQRSKLEALDFIWDLPLNDNSVFVKDETYLAASQILNTFKIPKSSRRTDILRYVLLHPKQEITAAQILDALEARHQGISMSTVRQGLRLFIARGLVTEIQYNHFREPLHEVGRPERKFMLTKSALNSLELEIK